MTEEELRKNVLPGAFEEYNIMDVFNFFQEGKGVI